MARVVVIGAGMGGLAAAARLAAGGHTVTVCEQASTIGGKVGRLSRDGFTFDTGPSLLTLPDVYRDLFRETGSTLEDAVPLHRLDPLCRYRFGDGTALDLPGGGPGQVAASVGHALGDRVSGQWLSLLVRGSRVWGLTREAVLGAPIHGMSSLVRLAGNVNDVRTVAPWASLRQLGDRMLTDERLRVLLDRYATYTGSDPRRAPAALVAVPFVEQAFGGWYLPGGLRRLAEAVAERAIDCGASIRTGADVAEVLLGTRRVTGVRLVDGEVLPADVVVANADAWSVYRTLMPGNAASRRDRSRVARLPRSYSAFVMLLALRGRTTSSAHHTVLFPPGGQREYDEEFDALGGAKEPTRPVREPTVYICAPDDPATRPDEQHEAWFVMVNAPAQAPEIGMDWDAAGLATAYAEHVLAVMASRGVEVRDRLLWREVRTPADLQRETRTPGGSIYGASSNGPRAAFLRPANASTTPGLFLVGGSAHPGGGLPLVALSAAIVSRLVGPA